jgi:hypothetical protein
MIRHFIVSLATALLCFGCATDSEPKFTFPEGTRVGIMDSLEATLTHRHITIDRMNSFTKQIEVNWNIPGYLDAQLTGSLKKDGRFEIVPIKSPQIQSRLKQLSDQIDSAATRRRISKNLVDFIENLAKVHDLDVVIFVQSFKGESPWKIGKNPISLQGYGLLTRSSVLGMVGINKNLAHPYAQIRVTIFSTRPVARLGVGQPKLSRGNMDGFNFSSNMENVSRTELDKLRPRIQKYADQAVNNALRDANMISP